MKNNEDITTKAVFRYCIQQLFYDSGIREEVASNAFDIYELKRRISRAKTILSLPNAESDLEFAGKNLPRGWKLNFQTLSNGGESVAEQNVELGKLIADLKCQLNDPNQIPTISELMIHRVASGVISEIILENGMKVSDFWREVRKRIKMVVSV